jgi:hypothetical protein
MVRSADLDLLLSLIIENLAHKVSSSVCHPHKIRSILFLEYQAILIGFHSNKL